MKIQIKDGEKRLDGWYKDDRTGAIQCSDKAKYEQYMKQYRAEQKKELDLATLQNDVSGLKSELDEIKSLLLTLTKQS